MLRTRSRCRACKPAGGFIVLKHGLPDADSLFGLLFQGACSTLHGGFIDRLHHNKGFGSKRGYWPASADQLFPYGPDRTVSALVRQSTTHSYAEGVIVSLLLLHRPLAFPILMQDGNRTTIIATSVSRLRACAAAATAELSGLPFRAPYYEPKLIVWPHLKRCQFTATVLHTIAFGADSRPGDKLQFVRGYEVELFKAVDAVVQLAVVDRQFAWMRDFAAHLWVSMTREQRAAAVQPQPPGYTSGMIASAASARDPYRTLQYHLSQRTRLRDCDGPACGKTVHEKQAPGAYAKCAKCRVAQYCSRDCQKADWRRERHPHREICDMLQELCTIVTLDGSMRPDQWSDACRARAFPLDRVNKLITWASEAGVTGDPNDAADSGVYPTDLPEGNQDYSVCVPPTPDHKIFFGHKELEPAQQFKNGLASQGYLIGDIVCL